MSNEFSYNKNTKIWLYLIGSLGLSWCAGQVVDACVAIRTAACDQIRIPGAPAHFKYPLLRVTDFTLDLTSLKKTKKNQ